MKYNVAVLGGGPGGYEAAIRCTQYGLKTVLIEAGELGGTCLNRGCIPTKSLLHSAEFYHTAHKSKEYGVDLSVDSFDYGEMVSRKNTIVSRLRRGIESLEKSYGVTIMKGYGILKDANTIDVGGETINADNIILATGSTPVKPPIQGIDGENVLTSDDVLSLNASPESMVIIGGGVIGIEFATLYSMLNCKVTVLEMAPSILPGVDKEIVAMLMQTLSRSGVEIVTGAKVTSINGGESVSVDYESTGEIKQAAGSCCVVCVGRKPQTAGIGLEMAGIRENCGFVEVSDEMRTNVSNIYAIGDITGKIQLAHVAASQGMVAAANCAGKKKRMDYKIVPACVYTSPEIAYVGVTEDVADCPVNVGVFNLAGNGKAMVMGENNGFVKIISNAVTGEILGAQMLAPRATDMIGEIAAVMRCEGTIEELSDTIHPHPTICEAIMEAAHDSENMCCNAPRKSK